LVLQPRVVLIFRFSISGFEALLWPPAAPAVLCAMVPEGPGPIVLWFDLTMDSRWIGVVAKALGWRLSDVCR